MRRRTASEFLPLLTAANLVFLALLWAGERLVGERHWLTTLLTYVPQHPFGVPSLLLVVWAAGRRRRAALAANALAGAFFLFAFLGLNLPRAHDAGADGVPLRVMTYNIHHGSEGAQGIVAVVQQARPDVLCLQETNAYRDWPDPVPALRQLLPGWHMVRHGDLATFSRHPILSHHVSPLGKRIGRVFLEAVIEKGGAPASVINVHFAGAVRPGSLARRAAGTPDHLRRTARVRSVQMANLLDVAAKARGRVVIVGDFNTPPRGRLYRRLARGYRDAFREAGRGFGYTFRSDLPVLRIDYVWVGPNVAVRRCLVPGTRASDHRPVVADLELR